jgi:DNA-binding CsgD family transcriptional regulator
LDTLHHIAWISAPASGHRATATVRKAARAATRPTVTATPLPRSWDTVEAVSAHCRHFSGHLGFPYFRLSICLANASLTLTRAEVSNFPAAWTDEYRREAYERIDPALNSPQGIATPTAWGDRRDQSDDTRHFYARAAAHGLVDGFSVPIRCINGQSLELTLAGSPVPLRIEDRWPLYFAAYHFLCGAFEGLHICFGRASPPDEAEPLTDKQRQILILLMRGLGVKSIARALGLHARTVDDGLRRACARLGANSREQAIVRALASGQIQLSVVNSDARASTDYPPAKCTRHGVREPDADYNAHVHSHDC